MKNQLLALLAFVRALYARVGEEVLKTFEAADRDLPMPVGRATRSMAHKLSERHPMGTRGQLGLGTILAAFVVVIAAFVVLLVVDEFDQSVDTPSSSALSTAENDILGGFGSMMSLVEPLLLIAIGVVIIGVIRRIQ